MNAYKEAMRRYFDFSGRSSRTNFWMFMLIYFIIYVIAAIIDGALFGMRFGREIGIVTGIVGLVHIIPSIAVGVRRLHDTDRSGWWWLIALIPLIGSIWLIVLYCFPGTPGANRFGQPQRA